MVGTYIAMNVAQSGSRFCVLHPALYQYICTGQYAELPIEDTDIPDADVQHLLSLVSTVYYNIMCNDVNFVVPIP